MPEPSTTGPVAKAPGQLDTRPGICVMVFLNLKLQLIFTWIYFIWDLRIPNKISEAHVGEAHQHRFVEVKCIFDVQVHWRIGILGLPG